jgi:hypothetical protein
VRGRGKETETKRRTRGLRGSPEFDLGPLQYGELRRLIATAWRGSVSEERENRERGSRGLMGKGLKGPGHYWGRVITGSF